MLRLQVINKNEIHVMKENDQQVLTFTIRIYTNNTTIFRFKPHVSSTETIMFEPDMTFMNDKTLPTKYLI